MNNTGPFFMADTITMQCPKNQDQKLLDLLVQANILSADHKLCKRSAYLLQDNLPLQSLLITRTAFIEGPAFTTLRQRVYVIKHNLQSCPCCIVCGKQVVFRTTGIAVGYPDTCSAACGCVSPLKISRRIATSKIKYGTNAPQQSDLVKQSSIKTNVQRYGVDHKNQSHMTGTVLESLQSKQWLYNQHFVLEKTLSVIAKELDINVSTVQRHLNKHDLFTKHFYASTGEKQIGQFLTDNNIVHETNIRTVIAPLELDIYIPEFNLAIEYCGLYWHSDQLGKTRSYHKNKHDLCVIQGIQLLTIYEDEWMNSPELVKSKILHLVGKSTVKKYARKLLVKSLTSNQKRDFFNANHLQGNGPGSISYGLYDDSVLVAAISFIQQQNGRYDLNRYATSIHVVGGFSKLLTHFKKNHDWTSIVSFADQRWSNGNLYKQNGFELERIIPPEYYYSPDGHTRFHKFNYRRKNLARLLDTFDPTLSEWENCKANNVLKIWDCGKQKWVINT